MAQAAAVSNLRITPVSPVKITDILQNSEKNRRKFGKNLRNLPSPLKINKSCVEFSKNGAQVLKICKITEILNGAKEKM